MAPKGFYEDSIIDEVRSKTDIVSLVSEYVKLRKAGRSYVGLCPFHEEKTPSFNVDPDKQFFYCFGCGTGGNVFTFLMKRDGLSFPEALRVLADRAGVRLPLSSGRAGDDKARKEADRLREVLLFAHTRYREQLQSRRGEAARAYLARRGLSPETIDNFQLGLAPDEWEFMATVAKRSGVNQSDLEKAGVLVARSDGRFYDRFRNRIMFPIWNSSGVLIGFGGRALGDDPAKYLNSPETPLFRKGKELYALNLAKPNIRAKDRVCLVEGYMDVVSCFQHGIDFAVAGMGTALTREQARALLLLTQNVYLVYDQDQAGKRAARRSIDVFRDLGGKSSVVTLDGAKDPDDFFRVKTQAEFNERLDAALLDVAFIYEEARRSVDPSSIEGKIRIQEVMVPILASLTSEFERSLYVEEISRDLGVGKESLDKDVELYKRSAQRDSRYKKDERRDTTGYDNQSQRGSGRDSLKLPAARAGFVGRDSEHDLVRRKAEEGVIRCLVENPGLFASLSGQLCEEYINDEYCRLAFSKLTEGSIDPEEDEDLLAWIAQLCLKFGPVKEPERILKDCLRRLQSIRLAELRDRIAKAEREKDEKTLEAIWSDYRRLLKEAKSVGDTG
jgi:DNA primase